MSMRAVMPGGRLAGIAMSIAVAAAVAGAEVAGAGPPEPGWTAPRTPYGHPDLQGIWSNNAATPLERPDTPGEAEAMSGEELADLQASLADLRASEQAGDPLGDRLVEQLLNDYDSFWLVAREPDVRTSLIVDPPDGRIPALTPAGRERAARRRLAADRPAGPESLSLNARCITFGVPNLVASYNSYFQILQTADHVVILQELIHDARVIPLDAGGAPRRGNPPVARRPARALGGRHPDRRDDQLFGPGEPAGRVPRHARDRALRACRSRNDRVHGHVRRSRHVGAALVADDPAREVEHGGHPLRVRLP